MYSSSTPEYALALLDHGFNDCEVARKLNVPRSTVRCWRVRREQSSVASWPTCPRCWRRASRPVRFTDTDYSELLGLYLGDGHIARAGRTHRLRLFLDSSYPGIIEDARRLIGRCFAANDVGLVHADDGATTILSLYCSHLICLFPQHGPGKKHERPIRLEPWQRRRIEAAPWAFLRGCIRSDGCVFINRTGPYSYLSYDFSNRSTEILALFASTCELAGVACRVYPKRVRICQRKSVELLVANVGVKQ